MFGSSPIIALVGALAPAIASPAGERHPFEACVVQAALTKEPDGSPVDAILASAEQACAGTHAELAEAAVSEIVGKARLAVMQQRSNALNTRRRG
jgi:hypothetical protein